MVCIIQVDFIRCTLNGLWRVTENKNAKKKWKKKVSAEWIALSTTNCIRLNGTLAATLYRSFNFLVLV